jgi:hypothetical protein
MLWNQYIFILRDEKFWPFTWMVQGIFIPHERCHFQIMEGLKSHLLSATLIGDKYNLHIINEIVSMVGPLKDLVYTYECKHGGLSCLLYFYCRWSSMIKHIALEFEHYQVLWVMDVRQTHVTMGLTGCQVQILWIWHIY